MIGWTLFVNIFLHIIVITIAYPQQYAQQNYQQQYEAARAQYYANQPKQLSPQEQSEQPQLQQQQQQIEEEQEQDDEDQQQIESTGRKFAVKPNASKKVALDDIEEDLQSNQIQEQTAVGFSWSNMLASVLQMFFNNYALNKSDDVDNGFPPSPWTNIISMGLKIITTILGGGPPSDGIDKVDNPGSPMQNILAAVFSSVLGARDPEQVNTMAKQAGEFINIVINLLDALKTSFSHRSLTARSLGKRDAVSDAAVASISLLKGYVKTYKSTEDKCMQKYLCEANSDCINEIGGTSIFCQLGTYATSFMLERQTNSKFENLYDAGRRGRSGVDCKSVYLECNEV
ncbi:uncharacterized protein LOC129616998 [Condylostylus longicornis]|uniref:uncharacterized protein LOC129616998 n=1 Tax=Condylostylus longicornis TaxID=2530218 RepID=UPI00244E2151|nr:uncharacterized protein LOC129616998 [Condylostylus longicornis]